ncbi:MAG: hypothetical protein L6R28_15815 [Planctomycetes bacterium]|nr:hypothetical protein [Planctomycetota bacterium]
MFEHLREALGLVSEEDAKAQPAALPSENELLEKREALQKAYAKGTSAKQKRALKAEIEELDLTIEVRKHLDPTPNYVLRRRSFINDILDALEAVSVAEMDENWHSVFRCNQAQLEKDFARILKELPAEEVAPPLWAKLRDQIQFTGSGGERELAALEASLQEAKRQLESVYDQMEEPKNAGLLEGFEAQAANWTARIMQVDIQATVVRAAVKGRNAKFKSIATDILAGMGPAAAQVIAPDLASNNATVRMAAGTILLYLKDSAIDALIDAMAKETRPEQAVLLKKITGQDLGGDAAAWKAWRAGGALAPAVQPKPVTPKEEPAEPVQPKSEGELALEKAEADLERAKKGAVEAGLLREALEKQLAEIKQDPQKVGYEESMAITREALQEALRMELQTHLRVERARKHLMDLADPASGSNP